LEPSECSSKVDSTDSKAPKELLLLAVLHFRVGTWQSEWKRAPRRIWWHWSLKWPFARQAHSWHGICS